MPSVAFPGPSGTFSEEAARAFGDPAPASNFAGVVRAVASREADWGVLALENAWVGAVPATLDLLAAAPVFVDGRVEVAVTLCLAALPGVRLQDIAVVRSHPHALKQARGLLSRMGAAGVDAPSTAAALDEVRAAGDRTVAALASPAAARARGLEVLVDDAGDRAGSRTRFVRIGLRPGRGALALGFVESGAPAGRVVGVRPSPRGAFRGRVWVEGADVELGGVSGRILGRYD